MARARRSTSPCSGWSSTTTKVVGWASSEGGWAGIARSGSGIIVPMAKQVLVVDDYAAVILALKVAFRLDGRFVVGASAATAAEGLERLSGQDAVLLDLYLPDMTGPALVR